MRRLLKIALLALLFLPRWTTTASTTIGPWEPLFKGINHTVGTNTPGGSSFSKLQVIHAIRVDLQDPDVQLFTSPRISGYVANSRESAGYKVSDFLKMNHLQIAINANFFDPSGYYLPAGTAMVVTGLQISRGVVVSAQESASYSASLLFSTNNQPTIVFTNWPAHSNVGVYTAVSGDYPLLINGINIAHAYRGSSDPVHQPNPRTAYGISRDRHYLFLLTIDGRQPGYSDGAYDDETAGWLLLLGAWDAVNLDGGGSTTLVMQDSTGVPRDLNHSNAMADSGKDRTVGSEFGIYALPTPGFINDVVAAPDDMAVGISWTTTALAVGQVAYGSTTNFTGSSALETIGATNHSALITGLQPGTEYYYRITATSDGTRFTSPIFRFATTNYLSTNQVFDLTAAWKYSADNLDGINWTANDFEDSTWGGPGPALLWVDVRSTGPAPGVDPKNTQMPNDPGTGYPFVTYYFRTHFTNSFTAPASKLSLSGYVDDGAVFYLNGNEVYRLRMPDGQIANDTLANAYPCSGDATCLDAFDLNFDGSNPLLFGDNVLSAEVHNYNALSADITFGVTLAALIPNGAAPDLAFTESGGVLKISWNRPAFALQSSSDPSGPWIDLPGPVISSPFTSNVASRQQFFRLRR